MLHADPKSPGDFSAAFSKHEKIWEIKKICNVSEEDATCLLVINRSVDAAVAFQKLHPHPANEICALKDALNIGFEQAITIIESGYACSALVEALQKSKSDGNRVNIVRAILRVRDDARAEPACLLALLEALQHAETDGTRAIVSTAICSLSLTGDKLSDAGSALISRLVSSLKTANASQSDAMRANVATAMYHLAKDHLFRAVLFSTDDAFSAIVEALQHAKTDGARTNFVKTLSLLNKIQVESCALISLLVKSLQTLSTTTFEAMPLDAMRANISALLLQLANFDLLVPTDDACSALLEALQHAETDRTRDIVLTAISSFSLTGNRLSDAGSALFSRLVSSLKTANATRYLRAIRLLAHNQDAIFALILQLARSLKTADSCAMRANVANSICFFVDDPVSRVALGASDDACSALLDALHHAETDSTRRSVLRAMLLFSQNAEVRTALISGLVSSVQIANAKSSDAMLSMWLDIAFVIFHVAEDTVFCAAFTTALNRVLGDVEQQQFAIQVSKQ